MLCPVCENEPDNNQKCNTCGWEFIYFINKPTQMEKQNHELLLQNYRAEFWYMRALEYHENEYYQEAIQFCFKSCEKQMFENPLVLLALTYKILENNEQSLKYANMALEINSSNEIAHELLSEFNNPIQESKEIIKLTPEILDKSMFETTEEYQDRIRNLGYVEVGEVELKNYDADKRELQFNLDVKGFVEYKFDTSINLIYDKHIYTIIINPSDAQNLYSSKIL